MVDEVERVMPEEAFEVLVDLVLDQDGRHVLSSWTKGWERSRTSR